MSLTKEIVEESFKTKKTRKKIKKFLKEMDKEVNPQALKRKSLEIQRWINRYSKDRVILKFKAISLFDENQNTANLSHKISNVVKKLTSFPQNEDVIN